MIWIWFITSLFWRNLEARPLDHEIVKVSIHQGLCAYLRNEFCLRMVSISN